MTYRVESWTGEQALRCAGPLAAVYHAAFSPYGEDDETAEVFRQRSLPAHADRDDFRCMAAVESDSLLGFGYGYRGARGQYWTDRVAELAPAEVVATWIGGHFEVVELAVLPGAQGRGIGTALHDALLADLPHPTALLSTWQHDSPARRLYLRRGWQALAELPDATLMGLRLPPARVSPA